ncbi:peptidylprolyl isomerase [Helicobacter cetorum]|uniref:Peptidyl-prolyl cis-trans isomerase D n=1 Tax=Helicobacter cetorum (strain ATCC BAA-540 / CCUG 52418 / MIT 99-5656) TaxID=1163745 RepID=I0ETY1_HELCM|nr:peptidylprolyl isomerase [Helicobacter cetorum]AFI06400.1 peptidyl-prolyl cis-trans isomerase D [Helicobacter cetorum MIT 99-5656]
MIEWMQKHKKYLVITIWISTVAFIAAGMIGWGQYSFSFHSDSVAKVGRIEISQNELAQEYRRLKDAYAESIPNFKELTEEQIKAMHLENSALNMLINQALLRNLALDLGLGASKQEIAKEIKKASVFQKDGVFDETLYKNILKENHYRPKLFEESVEKSLILQKISALFPKTTTPLEQSGLSLWAKLQDKVEILILNPKDVKISLNEDEMKKYYEAHKKDFKKPTSFESRSLYLDANLEKPSLKDLEEYYNKNKASYLDKDGKLQDFKDIQEQVKHDLSMQNTNEKALRSYVALKKGHTENYTTQNFEENNSPYTTEITQKLKTLKSLEILKPEPFKDGFIVVQLISKSKDALQSFDEAKQALVSHLSHEKTLKALQSLAKEKLKDFKGKNVGYISPNFNGAINELNQEESAKLVNTLFNRQEKNGFVTIGNKVVVYQITEQNFEHQLNTEEKQYVERLVNNIKTNSFDSALVEELKKRYKITKHIQSM